MAVHACRAVVVLQVIWAGEWTNCPSHHGGWTIFSCLVIFAGLWQDSIPFWMVDKSLYMSIYIYIYVQGTFRVQYISRVLQRPLFYIMMFFPTCQVRVVRFYVSCLVLLLLLSSPPPLLSSSSRCPPPLVVLLVLLLNCDSRSTVFSVGPQPRPSTPSVPCRTSTTTIHAQCSLPDLNREYPRPVFPAGPQPRPSPPSVPCRTSTTTIHAQCSLPDLNREYPRQVFPAGPHVGR